MYIYSGCVETSTLFASPWLTMKFISTSKVSLSLPISLVFFAYSSSSGPSELKIQIPISPDKTVLDLKHAIAEKSDVEADRQRLIYSGPCTATYDSPRSSLSSPAQEESSRFPSVFVVFSFHSPYRSFASPRMKTYCPCTRSSHHIPSTWSKVLHAPRPRLPRPPHRLSKYPQCRQARTRRTHLPSSTVTWATVSWLASTHSPTWVSTRMILTWSVSITSLPSTID